MKFTYIVTVRCETEEEAVQVMAERLGPDEDYGFDYTVTYERAQPGLAWITGGAT